MSEHTKLCKNCSAWGGEKAERGQCRRIPPLANGVEPASWPMTGAHDWCLEHVGPEQKNAPRR